MPRWDSNPYLRCRKPLFYPLNYVAPSECRPFNDSVASRIGLEPIFLESGSSVLPLDDRATI